MDNPLLASSLMSRQLSSHFLRLMPPTLDYYDSRTTHGVDSFTAAAVGVVCGAVRRSANWSGPKVFSTSWVPGKNLCALQQQLVPPFSNIGSPALCAFFVSCTVYENEWKIEIILAQTYQQCNPNQPVVALPSQHYRKKKKWFAARTVVSVLSIVQLRGIHTT